MLKRPNTLAYLGIVQRTASQIQVKHFANNKLREETPASYQLALVTTVTTVTDARQLPLTATLLRPRCQ
jgi:hypothetical protein